MLLPGLGPGLGTGGRYLDTGSPVSCRHWGQLTIVTSVHAERESRLVTMRKRYSDGGYPGYPGGSGGGRRRYPGGGERSRGWGAGGYRSRSSGPGARYNTIQGPPGGRHGHGQAGRYTGYRERTKSAPPGGRRHRSRSEDSGAMARRRSGERRTMTSFSLHPPESREGVRPVTPGRSKYDVDRQSTYYSRRAQSFIDKRYLPT